MRFARRLLGVLAVPALMAGFMMAGSANAKPAIITTAGPSFPYSVSFTATVITGGDTFALYSSACTLTGGGNNMHSCFLGGSGTGFMSSQSIANLSITGSGVFGPVAMTITQQSQSCGDGTAVVIKPAGPVTTKARVNINSVTPVPGTTNMFIIKGTAKIGPAVSACSVV
jgi:hypothetical protein